MSRISSKFDELLRPISVGYQDFMKNSITERIAVNYLIYRSPIKFIITLLPFSFAYLLVNLFQLPNNQSNDNPLTHADFSELLLGEYHRGFTIAIALLITLFLLYRWISIKQDGSYGYWISLGISRAVFIASLMAKFIYYITISYTLGLILLIFAGGIPLSVGNIILQILQVISTTIFILGIALLLSEFIMNASITTMIFAIIMMIPLLNPDIPFVSSLLLKEFSGITAGTIFAPFAFGIILLIATIFLHDQAEFDLR